MNVNYQKPCIVAEAGCNHKGDIEIAKKMIEMAVKPCGANVIKFQKRCVRELLTPEQYNAPHPNPENSYGKTYGEHREFLEFTIEQHAELKKYCEMMGITYSSSVWDLTSAKEIASLKPELIKIPSACNNHYKMIEWICDNYEGEIHISLGMTTHEEEDKLFKLLDNKCRTKDVVLYACTSGYPVPSEDICLLEIKRLYEKFGKHIKAIGFSGHHTGICADIAAYTLGASVIERHYTLDRTWKGTDHKASLEVNDLRLLRENLMYVYDSLTYKSQEILPIEQVQRDKLKLFSRES